jgi:hypothetical protein
MIATPPQFNSKHAPILPAAASFQAGASFPAPRNFLLSSYAQKRHIEYDICLSHVPEMPSNIPRMPGRRDTTRGVSVGIPRALYSEDKEGMGPSHTCMRANGAPHDAAVRGAGTGREERRRTCCPQRLPHALYHALVAGGLQADLGQIQGAMQITRQCTVDRTAKANAHCVIDAAIVAATPPSQNG